MRRTVTALVVAALSFLALPAQAQSVEALTPGVHQHDGFFLQLQAGPSLLSVAQDAVPLPDGGVGDMKVGGPGFGLTVAVGGSPVENLVLFGEVISLAAASPTVELDGEEFETDDDVTLSLTSIGPGVAYYFGSSSFFLGGSVGMATATIETGDGKGKASGVGFRFGAGKEWWVGDQWGIGLGANVFTASLVDDEDDDAELSATAFSLNLSATFQ